MRVKISKFTPTILIRYVHHTMVEMKFRSYGTIMDNFTERSDQSNEKYSSSNETDLFSEGERKHLLQAFGAVKN